MRAASSLATLAVALGLTAVGCDRFQPLVICHNANCVGPDVTRDDTIEAMTESLHLTRDGAPILDGMEIDTFWYAKEARCLFAHDLVNDTDTPASDAADAIADFLRTNTSVSWNGERFYMFIELKPHVGPAYSDAHTPEERMSHAECALQLTETILLGARERNHQITFGYVTGEPKLHTALTSLPQWTTYAQQPGVELMLIGDIFAPYSSVVPEIADYKHLDGVEYHPDFMTAQHRETYESLGIDLVQWSLVTTTEALAAIERWEPRFAFSNEAELLRRWADY